VDEVMSRQAGGGDAGDVAGHVVVWNGQGPVPAGLKGAVIAIGNFDGVHLGHQALLAEAGALARRLGRPLGVMTFEPHPRSFFQPATPVFRLTPAELKREALAGCGVSAIAELAFDASLAAMDGPTFIDALLVERLEAAGVAVGADFCFGRGRSGDVALLTERLGARQVPVLALAPVSEAHRGEVHHGEGAVAEAVSSSRVRAALADGDVALAARLLGRPWQVRETVVHGDKRGRLLGFPTANMVLPPETGLRYGIYAVEVRVDGVWRPGAASFGKRPTFDDGAPRLESFLFDFSGDLYGRRLDVRFFSWVRGEERFAGVEALVAQMNRDVATARALLAAPRA
jgi:riboflavin kinase/FMN adenylyltransferase